MVGWVRQIAVDLEVLEAMAELMWPRLVEVDGCVFLAFQFVESSRLAFLQSGLRGQQLERVLNHVHLYDVVNDTFSDAQLERLERVARIVREAWLASAAAQFPGRSFEVTLASEPDDYGPTVTLCQADTFESPATQRPSGPSGLVD
jgi:hypothetical protein